MVGTNKNTFVIHRRARSQIDKGNPVGMYSAEAYVS